jgi:hypothetical protein
MVIPPTEQQLLARLCAGVWAIAGLLGALVLVNFITLVMRLMGTRWL